MKPPAPQNQLTPAEVHIIRLLKQRADFSRDNRVILAEYQAINRELNAALKKHEENPK